tara:strand:- start:1345 stop:2712 length:1368 start_codon:yes stop_codon:yes gene_type:complete
MLNFRKLVFEAPVPTPTVAPTVTSTPTPAPKDDVEALATNVRMFFDPETENRYSGLKAAFEAKYKGIDFPNQDEFKAIVSKAANNSIRDTKKPESFPNIRQTYPLLDLVSRVKIAYTDNKDNNKAVEEANKIYTNFLQKIKLSTGEPIDFEATDPWAKSVKDEYFKTGKQDVGELALDKYLDKSIMFIVLKLLEVRRKDLSAKILAKRKNVDPNKIPNALPFVEDLILHPEKYAGGNVPVPDKLRALYDQVTARDLVNLGKLAKNFFTSEARKRNLTEENFDTESGYKAFLNNASLENGVFDWNKFKTQQEVTPSNQPTSENFNLLFNRLCSLLSEKNSKQRRNDRRQQQRQIPSPKPSQLPPGAPPPPADKTPNNNVEQEQNEEVPPTDVKNGYTLGNIKQMTQSAEAKALYAALKQFADYIRMGMKRDVIGAVKSATGAMKALSRIGGPMMGS